MPYTAEQNNTPSLLQRQELVCNSKITTPIAGEHIQQTGIKSDKNKLSAIFSTCPHLLQLSQFYASFYLPHILNSNWEFALNHITEEFKASLHNTSDEQQVLRAIRIYKNQSHYVISMSELLGLMSIEKSCKSLSLVAEHAIQQTASYVLRQMGIQSMQRCGWTILAMGKLGAEELNYSSDLDLISLHSASAIHSDKQFIELSQRLIYMLSTKTKDGNGWRIDMRLRPNPSATAISLDINTAIIYYESIARTWERAAFVRSRPIAGDTQLGTDFLSKIEPFIWRSTLDYSVIEDLQNWLRHLPIPKDYLGYDVKLGAFGIRHVELITHILQLLGGGRNFELRSNNTSKALIALEKSGWLASGKSDALIGCYYAWRRIEHRLQYQRDSHTHKLPKSEDAFEAFAYLMGYENNSSFRIALGDLLEFTKNSAAHPILNEMVSRHASGSAPSVTLPQLPELVQEWIAQLGFDNAKAIQDTIQAWLSGSIAATSSERAKSYLARLLPKMLPEIAKSDYPNAAFAAFQDIISSLPAGVQIFALLENNPSLVGLLSNILVKAPRLTETLRYNSYLLDDLLENEFFSQLPDKMTLTKILEDALAHVSLEQALDTIRKRNKSWNFQADIHLLEAVTPSSQIMRFRSDVASACLCQITYLASQDFALRHGNIDASLEIIAVGRLATKSLTAQSDLDLIFVYDGQMDDISDGAKPLGLSSYFIRLTQLITSWMSLKTAHGRLYELDLRLRPDGNAGPLAISSERFSSYYDREAWIWEFFALRDARTVLNGSPFSKHLSAKLEILRSHRIKPAELSSAFAEIQDRRKGETYHFWNLKQRHGGLLDCSIVLYIIGNLDKEYPAISNRLNQIQSRLEQLIQQLSTRLISYNSSTLPEQLIYFIAIQLGYNSDTLLKTQIDNDTSLISKILRILLHSKPEENS